MADRHDRNAAADGSGRRRSSRIFRYLVTFSLVGTVLLMGFGFYSVTIRGWMSCGQQFPLCAGSLIPMLDPNAAESVSYSATQIYAEWFHRAISFVTGLLMLGATIYAWWRVEGYTLTTWLVTAATALLPFEAYLGVLVGVPDPSTLLVGIHLTITYAVLGALVVATGILWWSRGHASKTATGQAQ